MSTFKDFNESLIPKTGDFLVGYDESGVSEFKINIGKINELSQYKFPNNLIVSLANNKTFGKYTTGQTIPCSGKTPDELIRMAIVESINPNVNLTSSTSIAFNQTSVNNVLNFNYTINTLGANVFSVVLEWRRNNSGNWAQFSISNGSTTYTHSDINSSFNTQPYNYRYTVTDSSGASTTKTLDITPAAYVAPTSSISISGASISTPESNLIREKGNVSSNISGSITRNSINVNLVSYVVQFQSDGGAWVDIGSPVNISGGSFTISSFNHNPSQSATVNSISYRIKIIDAYQQSLNSQTYSSSSAVSFKNIIFYGDSSSSPTNSSQVRSLLNKIFSDGSNPFNLITGTTNTKFTVALPSNQSISLVEDLDAFNLNITSDYAMTKFLVNDSGGSSTSYKVYTKSQAVPYTDVVGGHRHRVTRI